MRWSCCLTLLLLTACRQDFNAIDYTALLKIENKLTAPGIHDVNRYLFNQTTWKDTTDFSHFGTFTLKNGAIRLPAGQSDSLVETWITGLQQNSFSMTYRAVNGARDSAGVSIGYETVNNTANQSGIRFYFNEVTGKIGIYNVYNNSSTYGTDMLQAYTPGDLMLVQVTNTGAYGWSVLVFDLNTGRSVTRKETNRFDKPEAPTSSPNSSHLTVYAKKTAVAYDIFSLSYSTPYLPGRNLFVGDSIDCGFNAGGSNQYYAYILDAQIDAGPGDKSREVLLRIPEIIALSPGTVFLKIGTNDIGNTSFENWRMNVKEIVRTLRNSGIQVVLVTPPPNNNNDMTAYKNALIQLFPGLVIDIFSALKAADGTGYNPSYNSDGTHPNAAGHARIAQLIKDSPLWTQQ